MSGTTTDAERKARRAKNAQELLVREVLRLWPTEITIQELGKKFRASQARVYAIALEHGLTGKVYEPPSEMRKTKARENAEKRLRKKQARKAANAGKKRVINDDDPTPEELAEYEQRQEEIRRGWTPEEAYARFAGPKSQNYACRTYGFNHTNYVAYEMPAEA
jgi:hypothetical protein